jgi:hypothetical protein
MDFSEDEARMSQIEAQVEEWAGGENLDDYHQQMILSFTALSFGYAAEFLLFRTLLFDELHDNAMAIASAIFNLGYAKGKSE